MKPLSKSFAAVPLSHATRGTDCKRERGCRFAAPCDELEFCTALGLRDILFRHVHRRYAAYIILRTRPPRAPRTPLVRVSMRPDRRQRPARRTNYSSSLANARPLAPPTARLQLRVRTITCPPASRARIQELLQTFITTARTAPFVSQFI
ncbi:hypothetical protein EVAR_41773_1 [Eumeta japonica]|uniref:Uncharacterized protein n=1 Tax=Eumeta variegata TaxID=151549 RepID=A0A4C1VXC3_EUMVA|nr:hypothetical protein EVAR_41773_1 [Eumeta japonica]